MSPKRPEIRPTSVLSLLTTFVFVYYYFAGLKALPETVLLPIAGQVLSAGIHSLATIIFTLLIRFTKRRSLPIDSITPFLINLDTQLGGALTPERLIIAPLVTLLFLHTPETLLGTLAAGKPDIRSLPATEQLVELGSFGGSFNNSMYYTSGQLLLSDKSPDVAYRQVAYNTSQGWVVPRKPTAFYEQFSKRLLRDNDAEKRITVPVNEAAVLVPVPSLPQPCGKKNISDFGFWLALHHCESYIGFSVGGVNLPSAEGFYQLHQGEVSAKYASRTGERFVEGSPPTNMVPISFPRVDGLWSSMSNCFLNTISFNRPPSEMLLTERLVLSAVVRIGGIDHFSGYSTPPAMTKAIVSDVVNTNISRWVILTMAFAVAVDIIRVVLSIFNFEILAPELEAMVASFRHVLDLNSRGRSGRGRKSWYQRIWGRFEQYERGGGRWIITKGLPRREADNEGYKESDTESTSYTATVTEPDKISSDTE